MGVCQSGGMCTCGCVWYSVPELLGSALGAISKEALTAKWKVHPVHLIRTRKLTRILVYALGP